MLFTSKLSLGTDSSSSQASSVMPASKPSSSASASSTAAGGVGAGGAVDTSDQSSWENTSLTDESVRDELLGVSIEMRRRRKQPHSSVDREGQQHYRPGSRRDGKRDSKESVLTTSSDGGMSKFSEDLLGDQQLQRPFKTDAEKGEERGVVETAADDDVALPAPLDVAETRPLSDGRLQDAEDLPASPDVVQVSESVSMGATEASTASSKSVPPTVAEASRRPVAACEEGSVKAQEYKRVEYKPFPAKQQVEVSQVPSSLSATRYSLTNATTTSPKPFRRTSLPAATAPGPTTASTASTTTTTGPVTGEEAIESPTKTSEKLFDDLKEMTASSAKEDGDVVIHDSSQASLNKMNADIDDLLAEVDEHIRFSLSLDRGGTMVRNNQEEEEKEEEEVIARVKSDISEVRKDLSALRSDLSSDRKPLMDMMNSFIAGTTSTAVGRDALTSSSPLSSPVVKPKDSSYLTRQSSESSPPPQPPPQPQPQPPPPPLPTRALAENDNNNHRHNSREMEEVEIAMTQLARTISEFQSPGVTRKSNHHNRLPRESSPRLHHYPSSSSGSGSASGSSASRGGRTVYFSAANTGSVNQARSKFERKGSEPAASPSSSAASPSLRQRSTTPFRSARSPSPSPLSGACLRHRSPSPVKTGKVDRASEKKKCRHIFFVCILKMLLYFR